jgi:hypothetical protein
MNFSDFGAASLKDSTAFKKIQYFSKTNPQSLFSNTSDLSLRYKKLTGLYLNETLPSSSLSYGTLRQHNFSSTMSTTNSFNSLMDPTSLNKFVEYNMSILPTTPDSGSYNLFTNPRTQALHSSSNINRLFSLDESLSNLNYYSLRKLLTYPTTPMIGAESDAKLVGNPMKQLLNSK